MITNDSPAAFSALVQGFFCQHLIAQRNVSPRTVASYRDTFQLLLRFLDRYMNKPPAQILLADLDAPLILRFLDHLEQERRNSARSRNNRLAALRSFMRYASFQNPTCLPLVQHILAIPMKRFERPLLDFLSREEMQAIIDAPNSSTWSGHRDRVLFATLYNTGTRVSEIIHLKRNQVSVDRDFSIRIHGKGRKQRDVPLWKSTATEIRQWLCRIDSVPETPLFPNRARGPLTRSGVEYRLRLAVQKAAKHCSSLQEKSVSPHTLRHTTAMHLLQSGVDISVIALWLGHESPATTHLYIEADLVMKERALKKLEEPSIKSPRYKPTPDILAFLESL
jgi:site-specific recombinase XerD